MTEPTNRYADWHEIALQSLLDGEKLTTATLIERRGGGSATTASAALTAFYRDYLPRVLQVAALGAPSDVAPLVAEMWVRLAEAARAAAEGSYTTAREQSQREIAKLKQDLASVIKVHDALVKELVSAQEKDKEKAAQISALQRGIETARKASEHDGKSLATLQARLESMTALADERLSTITDGRKQHAADQAAQKTARDEAINEIKARHAEQTAHLSAAAAGAEERHAKVLAEAKTEGKRHALETRELHAQMRAMDDATSAIKQELAASAASATERKTTIENLRKDHAAAMGSERAKHAREIAKIKAPDSKRKAKTTKGKAPG